MTRTLLSPDDLLRGRLDGGGAAESVARQLPRLLASLLLFGVVYGAVMGTFGGVGGDRPLQLLYSGVKVPLLLLVTFALSLPSFFVLNTILGVRADFADVLRALIATQAGLTVILASLAPFTAFWYVAYTGTDAYQTALLFNTLMFAIASIGAQWMLRRSYRPLIARSPRHRLLLRAWIVVYAFVGVQMAWVLRPFIGDPHKPVTFFRAGAWGNAYEEVFHLITHTLGK